MSESNGAIDINLYTIENVSVHLIPAPLNGTEEHNISNWSMGNPLWKGNLEMHEIEYYMEDTGDIIDNGNNYNHVDYNPFNNSSNNEVAVAEDYFKLELKLVNASDSSIFARIPQLSSIDRNIHNIIGTVSPKYYAVYTEISDPKFNLNVIGNEDNAIQNNGIKRIGLGLKFESSYDASNFVMYLGHFKKDFDIFKESFLDNINSTHEEENDSAKMMNSNSMYSNQSYVENVPSSSSSSGSEDNNDDKHIIAQQQKNDKDTGIIGKSMKSMRDQFFRIDLEHSYNNASSDNDSSDDDFGDFQQV